MRLRIRAMPRHGHATLSLVTTGHSRSQNGVLRTPLPVVHAELQQANAGGSIRTRRFAMDCRVKPGNDGRKERKKNRKRNADRRNGSSPCQTSTAAPPYGGRTSIGVPPRLLLRRPNATAQLQSALPGMGPVSGRYPQTGPSQYSEAPRTGRIAGRAGTQSRPVSENGSSPSQKTI
jgi:hypothetical protein